MSEPIPQNRIFLISVLVALVSASLGVFAGLRVSAQHEHALADQFELRDDKNTYRLINPLLECDLPEQYLSTNSPGPARETILQTINQLKTQGNVTAVSYYFRDLNSGSWLGINERDTFFPASLLKIPLMLYYYRLAETNTSILDEHITFDHELAVEYDQYLKPGEKLQRDSTYTVGELVERTVRYSDNDAALLLQDHALNNKVDPVRTVFAELNLTFPENDVSDFMSTQDYSTFFRVLFNASYLNREFSEKALALTMQAAFNKGLTSKLPSDILVAHKFGEHTITGSSEKQLHDCGIVYLPKHPYVICLMTRGSDYNRMADAIADLSKVTFDELFASAKR